MRVLEVRNVNEALIRGLRLLREIGKPRDSRNGPVLYGGSVTTVYQKPLERVLFWSERDANPFFHLYESLWMLAGRNDVAGPVRYVKNFINYSDDGKIFHGAYGHRWRVAFTKDQLFVITDRLRNNPDDRRCVLQMWDVAQDLGTDSKDLPCNTMATFQRGVEGELNLTVFCRSNDIVWGAYGANAVHFATLLEYMAVAIGCPVGTYTQVSVNWHGYLNTIEPLGETERRDATKNPYVMGTAKSIPMTSKFDLLMEEINNLLHAADSGFEFTNFRTSLWSENIYRVLLAHHIYKTAPKTERTTLALKVLADCPADFDWAIAAKEWILRRAYRQQA